MLFAAFFNVIAIAIFHLSVAKTIGKPIANTQLYVLDHHLDIGGQRANRARRQRAVDRRQSDARAGG